MFLFFNAITLIHLKHANYCPDFFGTLFLRETSARPFLEFCLRTFVFVVALYIPIAFLLTCEVDLLIV